MTGILKMLISIAYLLNTNKHFFTQRSIYLCLTDNIVESLKASLIKKLFDNRRYKSNPWNDDFGDLRFDGGKRFITRRQIYWIKIGIVFSLINVLSVYVKKIQYNKNKILVFKNYRFRIDKLHDITKILKDLNWVITFVFDILIISWWWIDPILYYYIDQSNGSSIVWWLFKNRDFVRRRLKF